MEKFKAVEKEMKTKAYSKEGLQAAQKLDPREKDKQEMTDFCTAMIEELGLQIEQLEAEQEAMQSTAKKSKKDSNKAERLAEIERSMEEHRMHVDRLERANRMLENGVLQPEKIKDIEDGIRYYVENNTEVDFMEDETLYDDLDLDEEDEQAGDMDHGSSHDAQSLADDTVEVEPRQPTAAPVKPKSTSISESSAAARRPSTQLKSPLPALATLHTPLPTASTGVPATIAKPAPLPSRAITGEPLKYASAAAAAAASDKNGIGLSPLPPPTRDPMAPPPGLSPALAHATTRTIPSTSPAVLHSQPLTTPSQPKPVAVAQQPIGTASESSHVNDRQEAKKSHVIEDEQKKQIELERAAEEAFPPSTPSLTNGDTHSDAEEEESVYHLPSGLSDLLESFEATKASAFQPLSNPAAQRLFLSSGKYYPDGIDSERPQHYRPQNPYPYAPPHYPQEPLSIFEDSRLYGKCDTDTLFYSFYYKQGTYQQYAAAKALKAQSWRFHKQYQTWFQRHEEPKDITEDYEQGTYRFFDYESTW